MSYRPRRVAPLGVREVAGWRLKVTRVLAEGRTAEEGLVTSALEAAERFLPTPATGPLHDGVGVVIVHQGSRYDFVLVGYWTHETELRYGTFMRASSDSTRLEGLRAGELATDVWDLEVLSFERDAWLEHVLRPGDDDPEGDVTGDDGPARAGRLDAYLATRLDATL